MGSVQITHLLDTHAWVQRAAGERLPILVEETFTLHPHSLAIADISLWEVAKLIELEKLEISVSLSEFFDLALTPDLTVLPITGPIAHEVTQLQAKGFHKDPADQLIVATALVHRLRLITNDTRIRQWNGLPLLWRTARG
jgi:PIN domain nuclease of toxin-antitoxin system